MDIFEEAHKWLHLLLGPFKGLLQLNAGIGGQMVQDIDLAYHTYCYERANNEGQIGLVDGNWAYA